MYLHWLRNSILIKRQEGKVNPIGLSMFIESHRKLSARFMRIYPSDTKLTQTELDFSKHWKPYGNSRRLKYTARADWTQAAVPLTVLRSFTLETGEALRSMAALWRSTARLQSTGTLDGHLLAKRVEHFDSKSPNALCSSLLSDIRDLPTFCFRALSALNFGLGRRRNGINGTFENAFQKHKMYMHVYAGF